MNKKYILIMLLFFSLGLVFSCSGDDTDASKEVTFEVSVVDNSLDTTCGSTNGTLEINYGFDTTALTKYTNSGYACGNKVKFNKKTTDAKVSAFTYAITSDTMPSSRKIMVKWKTIKIDGGERLTLNKTCYITSGNPASDDCKDDVVLKF